MMNVLGRVSIRVANRIRAARALCLPLALAAAALPSSAVAQTDNAAFNKFAEHFDLGVMGVGQFTNSTTGTNKQGQSLLSKPSTDFNVMGQIRYTRSKWVGLEFNYVHGRYAYDFTTSVLVPGTTPPLTPIPTPLFLIVQTNAQEYSLGYVVHPHPTRLVKPFVSAGAGTTDFVPTAGGGEGLKPQGRATYFYALGADAPITTNFGLRVQFRQSFYLHPDFETNYLTDLTRDSTIEPVVGFYLKF